MEHLWVFLVAFGAGLVALLFVPLFSSFTGSKGVA
jgi:hypothetical protein